MKLFSLLIIAMFQLNAANAAELAEVEVIDAETTTAPKAALRPVPMTEELRSRDKYGPIVTAAVWEKFITAFKACAPGCEPKQHFIMNSRGCSSQRRAMNFTAISCDGQVTTAIQRGKFEEVVTCIKDISRGVKVFYRTGPEMTRHHNDNVYFSMGCKGDFRW